MIYLGAIYNIERICYNFTVLPRAKTQVHHREPVPMNDPRHSHGKRKEEIKSMPMKMPHHQKHPTDTADPSVHTKKKSPLRLALRLGCGTLALSALLALPVGAVTPSYARLTQSYESSRYGINLRYVNLTGDARTDIVMVAMSQLGYYEGDNAKQTNGETAGSGNFVEYNYFNGAVDQYGNGKKTYGYPWCASFVTWCARMAGIPDGTLTSSVNCAYWVNWFRSNGRYYERSTGYVPQKGDLIFFRDAGSPKLSTHVGIVRYTCGGIVYTIEGNQNQQVSLVAYALNDPYIIGYGVPAYQENAASAFTFLLDAYDEGNYIIAASLLPVFSEPGGGRQTATLRRGDLMHVYESRGVWGRTDYGWIHMPDTQPVQMSTPGN